MFKALTTDDKIADVAIVTSGVFQDGASSITTFFTSSTQYTNTGDYNVDLYRYDPANNASASVQFGVAFGHREGSGSLGLVGSTGDRATQAVYGQFNQLINPPQTSDFTFSSKTDVKLIYALTLNRARIRENLEPGGWELHLNAGTHTIKLIDDSSTNKGGNTNQRNFAPEYNIVSGSLSGGTTIETAASAESSTYGSYGVFYPSLGVLLLNPLKLARAPLSLSTLTNSNSDDRNARLFSNAVKVGAYFQAKRQEEITSRHYFVRATAKEFNATTNETFYTESVSGVKRIIPGLSTDPKTFITTVGLYNNENELLAIAKLSRPIIKSKSREALIKVKLDF
tara:strand:- start:1200 stop:2219 length:1020 start_codon:yes stop_codon:yes gene_type:complete